MSPMTENEIIDRTIIRNDYLRDIVRNLVEQRQSSV